MKVDVKSSPTPHVSLTEALHLASRRAGRPITDVRSAKYVSAKQLEARRAEDLTAPQGLVRFEPHWRIQFAGEEAIIDDGSGPRYIFALQPTDDILVFEDGAAMTFVDVTGDT